MFLACWFSIGVGFYLGLAVKNPIGFVEADAAALIRGFLLGIPFWPVGFTYLLIMILTEDPKPIKSRRKNGRV